MVLLDFIGSVLATTIEGVCLFYVTLVAFRFKPKEYINAIMIANVLVSITNYFMEKYNFFYDYTPVLNIIIMLLIFIFLFEISLFWSIVMSLAAFVGIFIVQGIVILVFYMFNQVSLHDLRLEDIKYVLQAITGICLLAIGRYLSRRRIGFSKVPFTRTFMINLTKFSTTMVITFLCLLCIFTVLIKYNNVMAGIIILLPLSAVVIYGLYRKEMCHD